MLVSASMRTIPLTQGKVALVDDEDFVWLSQYRWHVHKSPLKSGYKWYAKSQINGRRVSMHGLLTNPTPGTMPDHVNGDGLDNQKSNLRLATMSQNQANRCKGIGRSQYKGVCWSKPWNCWISRIEFRGKRYHLGYFDFEEDAALVYDIAAQLLFGEFALTNGLVKCTCGR